jgi:hypothetical protein
MSEGVQVPARPPTEQGHEGRLGELRDLTDGRDPPLAELAGGRRPDAPEPLDRERVEKRELAVTSRPSGLATPLATLARNFVRATPTVIGRPTRSRTSRRSRIAISMGVPEIRLSPRTSRNASSIDSPSTRGVVSSNTR